MATVHGGACDHLFAAEILVALPAEFAFPAGPVNPRHTDAITHLHILNGSALLHDVTRDLMPQDERSFHDAIKLFPIPIGQMEIGMADSARFHLDEHVVGAGLGPRDFLDRKRLLEFVQDGSFHLLFPVDE